MSYIKKLIFVPLFLAAFSAVCFQLQSILFSTDILFSFDIYKLLPIIYISFAIFAASYSFILFGTLVQSWNFILPVIVMTLLGSVFFFQGPVGWVIASGFALVLAFSNLNLESKLQSSINFQPATMLTPVMNNLSFMLIIIVSIAYFLSLSVDINTKGFHVPDSLIDKTLELSEQSFDLPLSSSDASISALTEEEIQRLKQNPEILTQRGIDPSVLNSLDQLSVTHSTELISRDAIKQAVKTQIDEKLSAYSNYIAVFMGLVMFALLKFIVSVISALTLPLIWLTFWIMNKIGFITVITEVREVKRLLVD